MPGRRRSLPVRILLTVAIVLAGPALFVVFYAGLFPSLPDGVGQPLMMLAMAWMCIALMIAGPAVPQPGLVA
jgi:hypothetical protein